MVTSRASLLVVSVVLTLSGCRGRGAVTTAAAPLDAGVVRGSAPNQQQLLAEVRPRLVALLRDQGFPLSCEDEPAEGELRAQRSWGRTGVELRPDGTTVVRVFREAVTPGEQGEGCCPPCANPCSESGCSYCAPADQCVEYATTHQLLATFTLELDGRITERAQRYTSEPERVRREPYVPPPPELPPSGRGMPFMPPPPVLQPLLPPVPPPPPPAGQAVLSLYAPELESTEVDREQLAAYVRARKGALLQCYTKALKRAPTLKGKVVLRFTILPTGRASELEIEENTVGAQDVADCLKVTVRGWVFPFKPKEAVPVAYPFVFSPGA